jgi:anthranilate synthase component II
MDILILDNYDSFTYNLYHMVEDVMPRSYGLTVRRNDEISLQEVNQYDKIIISPGPGLPKDAGITCDLIATYAAKKSILGVCLGHQAIAEVFGGKLKNLKDVLHGKAIRTRVTDKNEPLFFGCPETFNTGRYHSWVVDPHSLPKELAITAKDELDLIMAISHKRLDVKGVQFHPESVMTEAGRQILKNWVCLTPDNKPSSHVVKPK